MVTPSLIKNKNISISMFSSILKKIVIFSGIFLVFTLLFSGPFVQTQAQTVNDLNILGVKCLFEGQQGVTDKGKDVACDSKTALFPIIGDFIIAIAPFIATLVVIFGGFKYFQEGADSKQTGLKYIQGGVVGLVIVYLATFIIDTITLIFQPSGDSPFNTQPLTDLINQVVDALLNLSTVFAVLVIVWGGYKYFIGSFDEKTKGKDTIINGIIGLIVVVIARPLVALIRSIFPVTDKDSVNLPFDRTPLVTTVVSLVNNVLIPIAAVLTVFFVVIGAYNLILSNGDQTKATKGRAAITNAVIGLIVILLAVVITQTITYLTNNTVTTLGS